MLTVTVEESPALVPALPLNVGSLLLVMLPLAGAVKVTTGSCGCGRQGAGKRDAKIAGIDAVDGLVEGHRVSDAAGVRRLPNRQSSSDGQDLGKSLQNVIRLPL